MRANGNYASVTARQGGAGGMLEGGGYAALIHEVIDGTEEANPYVGLVLNILDPRTNKLRSTAELQDPESHWRHTYKFFVGEYGTSEIDWARYKALTDAVEQTSQNKGFVYQDMDGGERQLVGKWVGVVLRRYLYVPQRGKHKGEQREGVELSYVLPASDARAGNFDPKLAERRDARPDGLRGTPYLPAQPAPQVPPVPPQPAPAMVYDEDIPF